MRHLHAMMMSNTIGVTSTRQARDHFIREYSSHLQFASPSFSE